MNVIYYIKKKNAKHLQVLALILSDIYLGVESHSQMAILGLTFLCTAILVGFYNYNMREGFLSTNKMHTCFSNNDTIRKPVIAT